MKISIWDIVFLVVLAAFLIILNETEQIELFQKLPYLTITVAYFIGRLVGGLSNRKRKKE